MIAFLLGLGLLNPQAAVVEAVPDVRPIFGAASRPKPKAKRERRAEIEAAVEAEIQQHAEYAAELDAYAARQTAQLRTLATRYAKAPAQDIDYRAIAAEVVAQWLKELRDQTQALAARRERDDEDALHLVLLSL